MSSTIDTRVVQIQFDNTEFERNVQQTINSLERLNSLLDEKSPGGIDTLSSTINSTDFSNISSGVEAIKDRFSTLGIIGMTVLQRLTNAGIDMAAKIGGSIKKVGDQISQGGFVRAQNLEQAKFLLEGLGADVTAVMKDVDDALTGTAYGLDEGAKTAAIFFTSGVKQGKEMFTALRAVAGAAAMTGSSYQGIADVFQDAAAKGSIMTMEINRLQQQGVKADKYLLDFINTVATGGKTVTDVSDDVKKSVMDLTNGTKLSLEDLTEDRKGLLSKGAISFELFAAAMDEAFGPHAQEANKTYSGSLANMKTALSRLGEMFITPGMQAAIPLFNGLQASIKSFADTLKELGVIEEYTKGVSILGDAVTSAVTKLKDIGLFRNLAKMLESLMHIGVEVFKEFKVIFDRIFPEATIERLASFVHQLQRSIFVVENTKDKFDALYYVVTRAFHNIKDIGSSLGTLFGTVFSIIKKNAGTIALIFTDISDVLTVLIVGFANLLNNILLKLDSPIEFLLKKLRVLTAVISTAFLEHDFSFLSEIFEVLGKAASVAAKLISSGIKTIAGYLEMLTGKAKNSLSEIVDFQDALSVFGAIIGGGFIAKAIKTIKDFFDLKDDAKSGFSEMIENITSIPEKAGAVLDSLTESLETMQKQVSGKIIKDIALAVLALAVALKILATIDVPGLARGLSALTILLGEMMGALALIMKMVDSDKFAGSLKNISKMQVLTSQLIKLGIALVLIAAALKIISTLDLKGLAIGLGGLVGILGAVLGFVVGLDKLGGKKMAGKFRGVTEGLMGLALALLVLAAAVKVLSTMNIEELGKGLGSVVVLLGAIMGFVVGVSRLSSGGSKGMVATGIGMIAIATALNILAPALQKMGSLDMPTIGKGLLSISGALIAMAGASMFTSAVGSAGILAMAFALTIIASVIERIGNLDIKVIALGLGTLVGSILALAGVSVLLSAAIAPMLGISAAMLIMAAAVAVLGAGLVMIGAGLASIAGGIISFASVSQTAILMFANAVQTMIVAILEMLPQVAVALAESFVSFVEEIAALAPRFTEAATTIVTSLIEAIENNVPRIVETGLKLILELLSGVRNSISKISKVCAEIIAKFIEGIAEGLDQIIQAGFDLMLAFINGLADGIRSNTDAVKSAIINLCSAILEAFMSFFGISSPSTVMQQQGRFLMQGLLNGIKSFGGIPAALGKVLKSALTRVKGFVSKFREKGVEIVRNIVNGIKSKAHDIATNIGQAVTKAKNKITGAAGDFLSAGGNLVKGIASGIRNGASNVISAAGSIASRALSKFKSMLGIRSPSRAFAEAARWIPEGIVVGINKTSNKVRRAVSSMSDSALDPFSKAISKAYYGLDSGMDFKPTITPVLDLSEVRKDATGINSILGDKSIALASSLGKNGIQNLENNSLMNQLLGKMDKMMTSENQKRPSNVTNQFTINVDGAENPENFAKRFVRQVQLEMRTG